MTRIALITDLHIGARNDSSLFHDYYEKFYRDTFFPYLKDNDISTVICLGDTFDKRKQINFQSLERGIQYLFDPLQANNIHLYCLVGNHDAPLKNHIKISSPKLLLSAYKNIDVIDEPTELVIDDKKFLMIPWICADNNSEILKSLKTSDSSILCGHLELSGFEMNKGQMSDHGHIETSELKKFDRVWSGHYHHKSSIDNITYLGNPYELTWGDYDDPRGFHVYDTELDTLEFVENPNRMFIKYVYNDTDKELDWVSKVDYSGFSQVFVKIIVDKKTDFLAFDTFIHHLQESNPHEYKIIEDFSEFEESAIDEDSVDAEDTMTLLNKYIDGIETEIDKEQLKKLMRELYMESITEE
jgi:DNA repair exonuclease SbcCD nuclease subunit